MTPAPGLRPAGRIEARRRAARFDDRAAATKIQIRLGFGWDLSTHVDTCVSVKSTGIERRGLFMARRGASQCRQA